MAYIVMVVMAYTVMAYIGMAYIVYGLHRCGLDSYGLDSYDLDSYGPDTDMVPRPKAEICGTGPGVDHGMAVCIDVCIALYMHMCIGV